MDMKTFAMNIRNNGDTTAPLTLNGIIKGSGNLSFSANNNGKITLGGANTYSGRTLIVGGSNIAGVGMTVSVSSINRVSGGSSSSSLGAPAAGNGTIGISSTSFTSTLIYTGVGETTDRAIDLAGTTGGAKIQADGSGPVTFSSNFTATGAGSKTLTLQGSNTGLNTVGGTIVDNSGVNKTSLVKAQAGTWVLAGANTYSGGTTISGGTLAIGSGSIVGNVTNNAGVLELDSLTALGSGAIVALASSPANGAVYLNFTGTQPINFLYFGTTAQAAGTYGSTTSGADHQSAIFTGNGKLSVNGAPFIITQPKSQAVWPDASVTFSVVALGSPTYQWKHNGGNVGANSSSYTINPVEAGDAGTYTCFLQNGSGNATTADAVLTVLSTNAYTQLVRGDSPISYWRLDETSGTVAYDAVGGNNGTYNNVFLNQTPGYSTIDSDPCIGLWASPSGSYVSVANYQAFNFFTSLTPTFTLESWAYFTNVTGVQRMFSTDQNVQPLGYMFGINNANQLVFTTSGYQDYFMPPTGSLASPLQVNVWYHLVVGCDGSTLHFYVNGQPVGSRSLDASPRGGTNGVPMCLGANGNFAGNYEPLKGRLDECAIYSSFLGDAEILAHYNATLPNAPVAQTPVADQPTNYVSLTTIFTENAIGTDLHYQWTKVGSGTVGGDSSTLTLSGLALSDAGSYQVVVSNGGGSTNPPAATLTVLSIPTTPQQVGLTNSLVLHLPFDSDYKDISGHKNDGTNVNATTLPADSPVIGSGNLHFSSDTTPSYNYVTLGKPSDLQFGSSVDFTVAFWVRQAFSDIGTNLPFFASTVGSIGPTLGFCFAPGSTSLGSPNGGWAWEIYDGAHQDFATGDPGSISDGNWHHLAFVFDRTANATTYLDGQQVDSRSDAYLAASIDSGTNINIGQDATGTFVVPAATQADLDDLGVWRRALTQLEVSGMYLAGKDNTPGVSFAPVITAVTPTPTTISNILGTTLTYGGGAGSQFVLLSNNIVSAPLSTWTRVATNLSTPGSFTIPAVGSSSTTFYRVQSQ
jgi:autotransporter-associated beta strand protein